MQNVLSGTIELRAPGAGTGSSAIARIDRVRPAALPSRSSAPYAASSTACRSGAVRASTSTTTRPRCSSATSRSAVARSTRALEQAAQVSVPSHAHVRHPVSVLVTRSRSTSANEPPRWSRRRRRTRRRHRPGVRAGERADARARRHNPGELTLHLDPSVTLGLAHQDAQPFGRHAGAQQPSRRAARRRACCRPGRERSRSDAPSVGVAGLCRAGCAGVTSLAGGADLLALAEAPLDGLVGRVGQLLLALAEAAGLLVVGQLVHALGEVGLARPPRACRACAPAPSAKPSSGCSGVAGWRACGRLVMRVPTGCSSGGPATPGSARWTSPCSIAHSIVRAEGLAHRRVGQAELARGACEPS